jgi:phosphoribosylformimino-5-aminoimidazole carboxamide ribotide isomerase
MIIPVLDIKSGIAVSGKSGNRETYKPLKTVFHHSPSPLKIAEALKKVGASEIYIADLDSISGKGSNLELTEKINRIIPVMLDCGAYDMDSVCEAIMAADKVIVATETLQNIDDLYKIVCRVNPERIVISIDILNDKILSKHLELDFKILKEHLEELHLPEIILLDLSRVGTEKGINKALIDQFTSIGASIVYGGGITAQDLEELAERNVNRVLVGNALHNGKMMLSF